MLICCKRNTAYERRISDWSSDVCFSDLCTNRESAKFKDPAWLASVDYELTPDIFLYATTSGASMSGGFNSRNVPAPYRSFFDPEKVRDVELGFKGDFLDNKLRVNLAAFHAWQKGVQRIVNTTFVDSEDRKSTRMNYSH